MQPSIRTLIAIAIATVAAQTQAQTSSSSSSYSRFGIGMPHEQSQSYNRAMGGVAQGLRAGNRVNVLNPASYSAIDSLTFILDLAMSAQRTWTHLGGTTESADATGFENINAGFRLRRGLGMSIGFMPYTSIGYDFQQQSAATITDPYTMERISSQYAYTGTGGLHEAYIGIGWKPMQHLSVGANAGFLWGKVSHQMVQTFLSNGQAVTTSYSSLSSYYDATLQTWHASIGAQYEATMAGANSLTLGATIGIGHTIGSTATLLRTAQSGDTISYECPKAYSLPWTLSIGAAYQHGDKLTLAADAFAEQWSRCTTPALAMNNGTATYTPQRGQYADSYGLRAGAAITPDRYDRSLIKRTTYRMGVTYATSYLKLDGHDGPAQIGLSAGLGIPVANRFNNRSTLNISAEWLHRTASAATLMDEDMLRINIGLTFSERWFMKWQFR